MVGKGSMFTADCYFHSFVLQIAIHISFFHPPHSIPSQCVPMNTKPQYNVQFEVECNLSSFSILEWRWRFGVWFWIWLCYYRIKSCHLVDSWRFFLSTRKHISLRLCHRHSSFRYYLWIKWTDSGNTSNESQHRKIQQDIYPSYATQILRDTVKQSYPGFPRKFWHRPV